MSCSKSEKRNCQRATNRIAIQTKQKTIISYGDKGTDKDKDEDKETQQRKALQADTRFRGLPSPDYLSRTAMVAVTQKPGAEKQKERSRNGGKQSPMAQQKKPQRQSPARATDMQATICIVVVLALVKMQACTVLRSTTHSRHDD